MATKVLDRHGNSFDSVERRRRMGFMGGDLIADHDTASSVTPPERTYTIEANGSDGDGLPDKVRAEKRGA